jgi:hypothetical protein
MMVCVTDLVVNTDEIAFMVPCYLDNEGWGRPAVGTTTRVRDGWELYFKNKSSILITDLQYLELVGKL